MESYSEAHLKLAIVVRSELVLIARISFHLNRFFLLQFLPTFEHMSFKTLHFSAYECQYINRPKLRLERKLVIKSDRKQQQQQQKTDYHV